MSVLTESFVFFQLYQVSTDIFFSDFLLLFLCERENFDFFLSPIVLYGQGAVGNNSRPFVPMMVYLSMAKKKRMKKKTQPTSPSNLYDLVFWWYHYLFCFDFAASAAIAGQHGRRFEPSRSCRNDSLQMDQSDRIESPASPAANGSIEGTV